ncbi:unnamed protein product [Spirodela intermedia]|uniref:Aminotransferase class I/classII large domain-containing protein n=1 Tax=Spirodela intermedia TaxID=51605 RepID=A0A7I8I9A3_SPIIN|nr:unnamed protein product [Spirodela intermedia]CAA6654190.1 unnamed protein product [Spirodela intermedia]
MSLRGVVAELLSCANPAKPIVSLGVGDLSSHACFRKARDFSKYVAEAVSSGDFDGYPPSCGYPFARRAVADYLSRGTAAAGGGAAATVAEHDVFLTCGGTQALQLCLATLATRGCNVLLPRPGFPPYEATCAMHGIEPRYYDLLPAAALADDRTAALVVINPNNPSGAVFSRRHLLQGPEPARHRGRALRAHGLREAEFVPMAVFSAVAPILTIGALSKRWLVPGWRLGWIAVNDPSGALRQVKMGIERLMNISLGPTSIIQAAIPPLLSPSCEEFHRQVLGELESSCDVLYKMMMEVEAFKCYSKPQGAMFTMVEVNARLLPGIGDDMDFARELMREESILVLPGSVVGLKNWIRIFFGVPTTTLEDACDRIRGFCERRRGGRPDHTAILPHSHRTEKAGSEKTREYISPV